jgi:hypothetical protein
MFSLFRRQLSLEAMPPNPDDLAQKLILQLMGDKTSTVGEYFYSQGQRDKSGYGMAFRYAVNTKGVADLLQRYLQRCEEFELSQTFQQEVLSDVAALLCCAIVSAASCSKVAEIQEDKGSLTQPFSFVLRARLLFALAIRLGDIDKLVEYRKSDAVKDYEVTFRDYVESYLDDALEPGEGEGRPLKAETVNLMFTEAFSDAKKAVEIYKCEDNRDDLQKQVLKRLGLGAGLFSKRRRRKFAAPRGGIERRNSGGFAAGSGGAISKVSKK